MIIIKPFESYCSFKLDVPEDEATTIPEMNHKYISWNIYIVPSNVNSKIGFNREPTKLLRSSTSTSLGNDTENFIGHFTCPYIEYFIFKV